MTTTNSLLRKYSLNKKMPAPVPTGRDAIAFFAKRHSKDTGLDEQAILEGFLQHMLPTDADHIVANGETADHEMELRVCRGLAAAEDLDHIKSGQKIADAIRAEMQAFRAKK